MEVVGPATLIDELELELGSVNRGYKDFGRFDKQGSCNIDVVCSQGDAWREQIRSVGTYSLGGSLFCTGGLLNNTASDKKPFFLTADHCGVNAGNAASVVVYWNYESPNCGALSGGSLSDFQSGAYFRAAYAPSEAS